MQSNQIKFFDVLSKLEKHDVVLSIDKACKNARRLMNMTEQELIYFFSYEIYLLDYCYKNYIKLRVEIEKSLLAMLNKKVIYENIKFDLTDKACENSFVFLFFKYLNKNTYVKYRTYSFCLYELGIKGQISKKFIYLYSIFKNNSLFINECPYLFSLEERQALLDLSDGLVPPPNIIRENNNIGIIYLLECYLKMKNTIIHDEDSLNKLIEYKRSINYLFSLYECFDNFENICREKFHEFYNNNLTEKDVLDVNIYNFKYKIVSNTLFLQSAIDKWYIEVDKINHNMKLYHNNDGQKDTYHVQKNFKNTNLYYLFKYINSHDKYSLNRFDKHIYNKFKTI